MKKGLSTVVLLSLSTLGVACGGEDRPPATSEAPTQPAAENIEVTYTDSCESGESRFCRYYYVDVNGRVQCPIKTQFCKADGSGWLACGALPELPATTTATGDEDGD